MAYYAEPYAYLRAYEFLDKHPDVVLTPNELYTTFNTYLYVFIPGFPKERATIILRDIFNIRLPSGSFDTDVYSLYNDVLQPLIDTLLNFYHGTEDNTMIKKYKKYIVHRYTNSVIHKLGHLDALSKRELKIYTQGLSFINYRLNQDIYQIIQYQMRAIFDTIGIDILLSPKRDATGLRMITTKFGDTITKDLEISSDLELFQSKSYLINELITLCFRYDLIIQNNPLNKDIYKKNLVYLSQVKDLLKSVIEYLVIDDTDIVTDLTEFGNIIRYMTSGDTNSFRYYTDILNELKEMKTSKNFDGYIIDFYENKLYQIFIFYGNLEKKFKDTFPDENLILPFVCDTFCSAQLEDILDYTNAIKDIRISHYLSSIKHTLPPKVVPLYVSHDALNTIPRDISRVCLTGERHSNTVFHIYNGKIFDRISCVSKDYLQDIVKNKELSRVRFLKSVPRNIHFPMNPNTLLFIDLSTKRDNSIIVTLSSFQQLLEFKEKAYFLPLFGNQTCSLETINGRVINSVVFKMYSKEHIYSGVVVGLKENDYRFKIQWKLEPTKSVLNIGISKLKLVEYIFNGLKLSQ
jgi:hypothetical protein